jgi:hypothetical protein
MPNGSFSVLGVSAAGVGAGAGGASSSGSSYIWSFGLEKRLPLMVRRGPLLLRRCLKSGRSEMAFASAFDSPFLPLTSKLLLVGDVLRPVFPATDVSVPLTPPLLCKLLLLLPDAALPIECRFRSLELARCRS